MPDLLVYGFRRVRPALYFHQHVPNELVWRMGNELETERSTMYWMFIGYLASFYAVLAVDAVRTLPTHSNPQIGLFAYILMIPGLIAAVSAEAVLLAPDAWKAKIRQGFKSGSLTRLYAFGSGAVTSLGVLLCGLFAYFLYEAALSGSIAWLKPHEKTVFNISVFVWLLLLAFGPILPGAWLATKAERLAKK